MIEATDKSFEDEIIQADKPTLVDFWAVWCAPCRMIAPIVEEIATEYSDRLQVAKLDVDSNRETSMQYGVMSIPTLILFHKGEEVERIVGYRPKQALVDTILPYLE